LVEYESFLFEGHASNFLDNGVMPKMESFVWTQHTYENDVEQQSECQVGDQYMDV